MRLKWDPRWRLLEEMPGVMRTSLRPTASHATGAGASSCNTCSGAAHEPKAPSVTWQHLNQYHPYKGVPFDINILKLKFKPLVVDHTHKKKAAKKPVPHRVIKRALPASPGQHPDALDIKQGGIGDCYVLSTLGVVAHQHPEKICELLKSNPDGTYSVTFQKPWTNVDDGHGHSVRKYISSTSYFDPRSEAVMGSTPAKVTFDDAVPKRSTPIGTDFFALKSDDGKWAPLMEKAYAKEYGGGLGKDAYAGIGAGGQPDNVFRALGYEQAGNAPATSANFDTMRQGFRSGVMYVAASNPSTPHKPDPPGVPPTSHAYMVMGFNLAPDGSTMVRLLNPWNDPSQPYGQAFSLSKADFLKYYATIYGSEQP